MTTMPTTTVARDEAVWDAFVQANGGSFLQSWSWSVFQEAAGRPVLRFRVAGGREGTEGTVAQFLLIVHRLPLGARYAYIPRGPVIAAAGDAPGNFQAFLGAVHETLRRESCLFARLEPPFLRSGDLIGAGALEEEGLVPVRAVQPADTVIIDLGRSEAELLAAMHPKTRYNIRLAEKHGVTVREAAYDGERPAAADLESFWRLLAATAERDKFHTHPRAYYEKMLDILSPRRGGGLKVRLVFAEHEGRPVAATVMAAYGDTLTYLHGASDAAYRRLMAPNLLHWRLMTEAKRQGLAKYDLWGVAPNDDPEHPWAGITRFKTGFGGRRESYLGAWELPMDEFWYNLYRFAKRFRNV